MDFVEEVRDDKDLLLACNRFGDYFFTYTKEFRYTSFTPVYQKGPTCGLTALGMYMGVDFKGIERILEEARGFGFTKSGEMFSARDMCSLTKNSVEKKIELFTGYLHCDQVIEFLKNGGVMLVPYDADANHEPCLRNGHKAHWALVSGIIVCQGDNIFIMARQGKSKILGIWALSLLAASNAQLIEVSPDRCNPNEYVIPVDGIAGDNGLCNKAILIYDS